MTRRTAGILRITVLAIVPAALVGCMPQPGTPMKRLGDEIIVAGQFFHTGTRVVTYLDPGGYNAYRCYNHFDPTATMPANPSDGDNPNRYSPTRRNLPDDLKACVEEQGWTLENVQKQVDQFVIHYDVCATSAQCFYILHDYRGLSVQFMLDLDGTIYQTIDIKERAWHGNHTNDRSIGVEIAHPGAYGSPEKLETWYAVDAAGWPYLTLPDYVRRGHLPADFVARPARKERFEGVINGSKLYQYDFTNEQYAALVKLTAALHRVLPKLRLEVPRDDAGQVIPNVLPDEDLKAFSGLIGHWHVIKGKVDPGPAFDWDRVLTGARRELGMWW